MAYANKKYHSGWIWIGVTKGLAGIKFSLSPNKNGYRKTINMRSQKIEKNPMMSLKEK